MTIRDFFRIIIKLFCVYSLIQVSLYYIPRNAIGLVYTYDLFWSILGLFILVLISAGIFMILIKKVDPIIDWLKLDKGFDQNQIQIGNFNEIKVISIAIILIGGMVIVDYLPNFLNYLFISFKKEAGSSNRGDLLFPVNRINYFDWGISAMNLLIGYLLIVNHSFLSKKLAKLSNESKDGEEE